MAKTVYSGLQGSGKSYEVVSGVILPNVAKGRRVVTNVAGLQIEKINAYCVEKLGANPEKLGQIIHIENDDVLKPNFFPVENSDNAESIVQGGDIVIFDECWRWYVTGEQLPKEHLTFFRMHRHFTHPETGQCCDIVLIVQDIGDLQRKVLATVEKSFLMQKHKDLGMPNRYVVGVYSGKRQCARTLIEEFNKKYDPEIFALYSSYSQSSASSAKEEQADNRGNIFNRKIIKYGLPVAVLMLLLSFYFVWKLFHPAPKKADVVEASSAAKPASPDAASSPQEVPKPASNISQKWRLIGSMIKGSEVVFIMADSSQRLRYITNPPAYKISAGEIELALPSGEIVTRWSGSEESTKQGMTP
jgi:zona occludens toxin